MAQQTELERGRAALVRYAEPALAGLGTAWQRGNAAVNWLRAHIAATALGQFLARSITRRILVSNLVGLCLLLGGLLWLSRDQVYLIKAKEDSLRVQGEIIAAAIAANAMIDTDGIVLEPDRLPQSEASLAPFRDDSFTRFELSIRPERVTPILRRLIQPTNTRARIYGRDGALVVNSATMLLPLRGRSQQADPDTREDGRLRVKNFWTRLTAWLEPSDLPVYREIGTANGTYYAEVRAALTGTTTPMLLLDEKGNQIVSMAVPVQRFKAVQGVLLLSTRPGEIDEIKTQQFKNILYLAMMALAATLVASIMLARSTAGPMRRLSAAAENVSRNFSAREALPVFPGRTDEVGMMAGAFAKMTEALYRRAEASESFAADVAHELKNPLTAARSTAESLAYAKSEKQRQELVETIQQELSRLNRLITDVSNASRLDAELALQERTPVDLRQVIDGVVSVFRDITSENDLRLTLDIAEIAGMPRAFVVQGHEGRLGQVLTNLVDNAISFSPDAGTVAVRARRMGAEVEMSVEDDGPGIPEDKLEKVFERFYTDRPQTEAKRGKNSGLGLSISREIVKAHNGQIWAENRTGVQGARFVVRLPAGGTAS